MKALYLLSVWVHILAAAIWIGGMIFLVLILFPLIRQPEYRGIAAPLIRWIGLRFRSVGWICLGLLLFSGIFNLVYRSIGWEMLGDRRFWQGPFGQVLGIKLLLVAMLLLFSALHDFFIGPKARALLQINPAAPGTQRLRRRAAWIGRLNLFLALVVVALGVMLVRGWPW